MSSTYGFPGIVIAPDGTVVVPRVGAGALRMRLVAALPLRDAARVAAPVMVVDPLGVAVVAAGGASDLDGALLGDAGLYVHRLALAGPVTWMR
jgi:hypothetical protein